MESNQTQTAKNRIKALLEALHFVMPQSDFKELAKELVQHELMAIP